MVKHHDCRSSFLPVTCIVGPAKQDQSAPDRVEAGMVDQQQESQGSASQEGEVVQAAVALLGTFGSFTRVTVQATASLASTD